MASKLFLAFVAQALLIQAAFAQCGTSIVDNNVLINNVNGWAGLGMNAGLAGAGRLNNGLGLGIASAPATGLAFNNGLGLGGLGLGNTMLASPAYIDLSAVSAGGLLPTSCVGPIIPGGLSVLSDNAIEGALLVTGQLPFLSAVTLEGTLASAGSGAASCGCGNGNIGILSESAPASILPAVNGLGLGGPAGINRRGCL